MEMKKVGMALMTAGGHQGLRICFQAVGGTVVEVTVEMPWGRHVIVMIRKAYAKGIHTDRRRQA